MPTKKAPAKPIHKKAPPIERMPAAGDTEPVVVPEAPPKPRVMQVVEVEEEAPHAVAAVEPAPVATEAPIAKTQPVAEASAPEEPEEDTDDGAPDTAREREAEVVSGLFRKEVPEVFPEIAVHKAGMSLKPVYFWAITVIVAVVIIGAGLLAVGRGGLKIAGKKAVPTPTPTVAAAPTPTPTPAIVKKDMKIQVLNGSGKAGVAGAMKKLLEEKGYTVAGTGNAKSYGYAKTEIRFKADVPTLGELVKTDIGGSYAVGSVSASLEKSELFHAVVIVGKE